MGRVVDIAELKDIREKAHREGKKVVFTNGCFDLLHRGHVEYLCKARALGDLLVLGLNTDDSVKRIKGENRPILPQEDRAYILSYLTCVDYVCLFDEDTPQQLIDELVPDILVKGADWQLDEIVGRETVQKAGGRVVRINLVKGRSTSQILAYIVERFGPKF